VQQCLESYLPKRQNRLEASGLREEPALFVNKDGSRLSRAAVSREMKHLSKRCQLNVTLHQYRHTCASELLESGVNLPQVQQVLGHQSLETTMRYLHIADPQLHRATESHSVNSLFSNERKDS
jgi:site-specific recombinase XerD